MKDKPIATPMAISNTRSGFISGLDDAQMLDVIIQQCQTIMQDPDTDNETRFKCQDRLMKAISLRRKLNIKPPGGAFDISEDEDDE